MAATEDAICSLAMELLGHTPFSTFESTDDKHHKTAERLWPTVRDRIIGRGTWNSCIKRVFLDTPSLTAPLYDYTYRFPLPADWLRTLTVGSDNFKPAYKIEGGFVLVNAAKVPFRYVFRNEATTTYEPGLTDLLVQGMVARMALAVTGVVTRADLEAAVFQRMMVEALAIDAVEEDGDVLGNNNPLLDSRNN